MSAESFECPANRESKSLLLNEKHAHSSKAGILKQLVMFMTIILHIIWSNTAVIVYLLFAELSRNKLSVLCVKSYL